MSEISTGDSQFLRACSLSELFDSEPIRVEFDDVDLDLAVVRVGAEVFAIEDRCTHGDVRLSEGEVDDCTLECFLHGSRFDLRTGKSSGPPAIRPVAVYPVRVDGDDVLVDVNSSSLQSH